MAYGKGRATGYSDYFKNNSSTPGESEAQMGSSSNPDNENMTAAERRKAALRRRLQRMKAGK